MPLDVAVSLAIYAAAGSIRFNRQCSKASLTYVPNVRIRVALSCRPNCNCLLRIQNILAGRRAVLTELGIDDPRHVTLVDKMTLRNPKSRWNPQKVLRQSAIFESTFSDEASILLDTIELHKKPEGSCRQQLLSEEMLSQYPRFRTMVSSSDSPCIDSVRQKTSMFEQNICVYHLTRTLSMWLCRLSRSSRTGI